MRLRSAAAMSRCARYSVFEGRSWAAGTSSDRSRSASSVAVLTFRTVSSSAAVKGYLCLAASFVSLVILANWLASRYVVSVGFGRVAPAGVFCIGGVLVLRDWLQQLRGVLWTMPLVDAAGPASLTGRGVASLIGPEENGRSNGCSVT